MKRRHFMEKKIRPSVSLFTVRFSASASASASLEFSLFVSSGLPSSLLGPWLLPSSTLPLSAVCLLLTLLGCSVQCSTRSRGPRLGQSASTAPLVHYFGPLVQDSSSQCGTGASVVSKKMSCNKDHIYNERNQVRAKGCGKRLKGGKEMALGNAKNSKARRCHGYGKVGQSHDKRNCPMVPHRDSPGNEGATTFSSSEDDSHTSKEMLAVVGCC